MKRLSEYQAIIVDLDGTLYYQNPVRLAMLGQMLMRFWRFIDFRTVQKYRSLYERGVSESARWAQLPPNAPKVIREWMIERPLPYVFMHRDAALIALLERAQASGGHVIVYSDYPVEEKLAALRYRSSAAYCAGDCLKPDPALLKSILGALDIRQEDSLMIGDRAEKDGKLAENLGIDCVILPAKARERSMFYSQLEV